VLGRELMRSLVCLSVVLLAALVLAMLPGGAFAEESPERELADRIVAIANNEVVTQYELARALSSDDKYRSLKKQPRSSQRAESLMQREHEVLNLLLDRRLIVSEARRMGISPDEELIQKRIDHTMKRLGAGSTEEFERMLAEEGFTLPSLKALFEGEYMEQAILDGKVRSLIDISEEQIIAYTEKNKDIIASSERVNFAQILFKVADFEDVSQVAAAKSAAERALSRVQMGDPFDKVCQSAKDAVKSCEGLGFLGKDEMFPSLSRVLFGMKVGDVSGIIKSPMGFHIIRLLGRQGGDAAMTPQLKQQIREQLHAQQFESRYDAFIKELRAKNYVRVMLNAP